MDCSGSRSSLVRPLSSVAESDGVPGLATGADTLEELVEKLKIAIPELLAENGISFVPDNLPFKIEAQRSEYANVAA